MTYPNGPDFQGLAGVTDAVPNPNEKQPKTDEFSKINLPFTFGPTNIQTARCPLNPNINFKKKGHLRPRPAGV